MNNGDFDARYGLAHLYEEGIGIPKDKEKAMALYEELAYKSNGN
jgi:TPR repeat protein